MLPFLMLALLASPSSVVVDNDLVRVVLAQNTPGQKSGLHKHDRNRVMIHVDPGAMRLDFQNGGVKEVSFRAGDVRWDPAGGFHTSENTGGTTYRIVEIELKKASGFAVRWSALDPPTVDPRHYKVELENEQVRVVRARYNPKDSAPMHEHALPRVTVNLTSQNVRLTLPDGKTTDLRRAAGEIVFTATPGSHSEVNLEDRPFEVLLVEFKTN